MIDDVASFVAAAEVLKERGAYKIYVMATHCLLSSDAPRLIDNSQIDEVCMFVNFFKHFIHSTIKQRCLIDWWIRYLVCNLEVVSLIF